jgi:hypothetical protein
VPETTVKLKYRIDGPILKVHLEGDYPVEEFLGLFEKAFNDPLVPERVAILMDGRFVSIERSSRDIERITDKFEKWNKRIICEAVIVSSDYVFGVLRQASSYAEFSGRIVRPFRDPEAAREWIMKKLKESGIALDDNG